MNRSQFVVRLARDEADLMAAQRLRYTVFVEEMGGVGRDVDHEARLERDAFDPHYEHLLLIDTTRNDAIVGVYRLMQGAQAAERGGFYSAHEYDLTPILSSGRKLLELGRSCLHRDYRGGVAMHHLWSGLARYVTEHEIEVLFGVASFPGTDVSILADPLSLLHSAHLAPPDLRVQAWAHVRHDMNVLSPDTIDRIRAMQKIPTLIKAYLRLGGVVGDGAYIDHDFNTVDVCMVMDTTMMSATTRRRLIEATA